MKSVLEICRTYSPYRRGLCGQRGWCGQRCWGGAYRGVGELFILLLLAGVAGLALLVYAQAEREDLRHDQALVTGKLVGTWLHYAHLYVQDYQQDPTVITRDGEVIPQIIPQRTLKNEGYAPVWLQETSDPNDRITLGIIDDGSIGIAMAFVIWNRTTATAQLPLDFRDSVAEGISLAEGLNREQFAAITGVTDSTAQIASAAQSIGLTLTHRANIETLLRKTNSPFLVNGKLPFGTIIATADSAIAYNADALYRRRQPGHPELNRMLGDINLGENNFTARTIAITSGEMNDVTVKETAGPTEFNNLDVERSVTAKNLNLDSAKGMTLNSVSTQTRKELLVGTLVTDTLQARNIVAEEGAFTTGLNIQNQNPSSSSYKDAFGDIIVSGTTTATNARATTIKGGTTPSGALPSPGELITHSDSVTTDKLYTQKAVIKNTLEIKRSCEGC